MEVVEPQREIIVASGNPKADAIRRIEADLPKVLAFQVRYKPPGSQWYMQYANKRYKLLKLEYQGRDIYGWTTSLADFSPWPTSIVRDGQGRQMLPSQERARYSINWAAIWIPPNGSGIHVLSSSDGQDGAYSPIDYEKYLPVQLNAINGLIDVLIVHEDKSRKPWDRPMH